MPNALADMLASEIEKRDNVHENLEILDTLIHELLELTRPVRTLDEDCNCGKAKTAAGEKPYT